MTLAIGIDATAWENRRGDGRFVRNAVGRLVASHPEVEWTLYLSERDAGTAALPPGARARPVPQRATAGSELTTGASRSPLDLARLALAVRRDRPDAFLAPSVLSWYPTPGVPAVVGLHDATSVTHADLVLPARLDRLRWGAKLRLALRSAERLFTVSAAARQAISLSLGVEPSAFEIVPEAADPGFSPQPGEAVEAALAELGIGAERPYLVFAAGIGPHKGLGDLIEAFASIGEPGTPPELVVAGSEAGPYVSAAAELRERAAELGVGGRVRFAGFVPDATLAALYSGARGAIAPSHSEGFGLAPLEAAACGAPVVLSDIGPHRETMDGAALFFPPGDRMALAKRLRELLGDPGGARELGERGREAAARFSWDESARRLYALLRAAAGVRAPPADARGS